MINVRQWFKHLDYFDVYTYCHLWFPKFSILCMQIVFCLATLMIDDDLPTQVKKRNIPAIKPGELVVTNSKVRYS